ncbi:hypothetical protein BD626DRAFT_489891 [Schizophyllum amplum]|uniref:Uncharacterized protein n=1 Tax=Schizophyllum amplum TaxID=97359 RepID=A0A550CJ06_9AGAR|nr:hypothetical protein BD626DRAFT_489891 [Auriculariopsis ampla]
MYTTSWPLLDPLEYGRELAESFLLDDKARPSISGNSYLAKLPCVPGETKRAFLPARGCRGLALAHEARRFAQAAPMQGISLLLTVPNLEIPETMAILHNTRTPRTTNIKCSVFADHWQCDMAQLWGCSGTCCVLREERCM